MGWGPPVIADKADDSYRALGVGRSVVASFASEHPFTNGQHENRAGPRAARECLWRLSVRLLFADFSFAISVFLTVAIAAAFAFAFDAPLQVVVSMLVMGLFTATAEYRMRSRQQPP